MSPAQMPKSCFFLDFTDVSSSLPAGCFSFFGFFGFYRRKLTKIKPQENLLCTLHPGQIRLSKMKKSSNNEEMHPIDTLEWGNLGFVQPWAQFSTFAASINSFCTQVIKNTHFVVWPQGTRTMVNCVVWALSTITMINANNA